MNHRTQAVQPPRLNLPPAEEQEDLHMEKFFVELIIYRDDDKKPVQKIETDMSPPLFKALKEANLKRSTVWRLRIGGTTVRPQCVARINHFLHLKGYKTNSFRGWRIRRENTVGSTRARDRESWAEFLEIIGFVPKS